jgi:hypothetical protein
MTATFSVPLFACLAFAPGLFGQIDSSQLRGKYGPPLARETFVISPGFELIVQYGPSQQVCRLEPQDLGMSQRADDLLLDLVPMSMRGKNLGTMLEYMGRASIKITEYENVAISELQDPDHKGMRTSVRLMFKRDECRGL